MLTTDDIVPYCGVVLARSDRPGGLILIVQRLKKRIRQVFNAQWTAHGKDSAHGGRYITCFFSYQRPPHWAPESAVLETTHAYFSVGTANGYFIFHCSDNDVKDEILDLLDSDNFGAHKIARDVLNYAFIEGSTVKTLWLHGIHNRTAVKADSKAITGSNLELALDPSGDQSYSYNSLRGNVELLSVERTFGVNLSESYLWLYRMKTWREFLAACDALTEILQKAKGRESTKPLEIVSHPISDTTSMKGLFDFSIVDGENPTGITLGTPRSSLLSKLRQEYDFEPIHHVTPDNIIRLKVHHRNNGLRSYLGEVHAEPTINAGKLSFDTQKVGVQPRQTAKLQEFARIFLHPPLLQAWYDSGHSIAGGACYEISYKNAPFNGMYWADFSNFDLTKEKPAVPAAGAFLSNIGAPGEDSLFSWVYVAISKGSKAKRLSHVRMRANDDWLLCDDGSGEISDFLHATTIDNHHHLTLIHVKAAHSDQPTRLISVSAHDIVINQAIKNINHLNKSNLLAALNSRIGTANTKPAWTVTNGVIAGADASDFVDAVSKWSAARISVHVVIVQPHTLRTAFRNKANTKPHYQLCTLLNSAAHQVAGLGGTFTVIGART